MVLLRNVVKVAAVASGCVVALKLRDEGALRQAHALTSTERRSFDDHFPRGTWDDNWDFRSPEFLLNAKKYDKASDAEKKKMDEEVKATATRHIILIRHGQYVMDSEKKNLTPLGREQAALVGKRLADSGLKFDGLVMSTMARATETAEIILERMPELKRISCSLLEEGPPYPPVPAVDHWKPPTPALQFPPEGWLRMSLGNCSITWLVIRPSGRVSLRSLGDVGHLPPSKISYT